MTDSGTKGWLEIRNADGSSPTLEDLLGVDKVIVPEWVDEE